MKNRKVASSILALTLAASLVTPAFATGTVVNQPGTGESNAVLTAEGATFNVTLPTILPIDVTSDGTVITSKNVQIVNQSSGPVEINAVDVTATSPWKLVDFGKLFTFTKVGTQEFGLQFNGTNVPTSGQAVVAGWDPIAIGGNLKLVYDANIAPQRDTITDATIAKVVFTVGWSEADLELNNLELNLEKGKMAQLSLSGTSTTIWESSNTSVATVSESGLVTAIDIGTATIQAQFNGKVKECVVTVIEAGSSTEGTN